MSFVRPEAARALRRWREALAGAALAGFGAWWLMTEVGARFLAGGAAFAAGLLLIVAGYQRARFRRRGDGPGIVRVDERELSYFGPEDGAILSVDDITRLDLAPGGRAWIISHRGGPPVSVPVDAAGAEALFDVFAALPGLDTDAMLGAMSRRPGDRTPIWTAGPRRLH